MPHAASPAQPTTEKKNPPCNRNWRKRLKKSMANVP
jgi:hypothetical protein